MARVLARLAEPLGFHPVTIARPALAALAALGEHVLIRMNPDGFEQVIVLARGESITDVVAAAEAAAKLATEKPELSRDEKLRISVVGIGLDRHARGDRRRLLAETRLLGDRVVIRRFFLSLDARRLDAGSSPWSFAPGFRLNPCDPDENVFVSLVRNDRYLKGPAETVSDADHRSALAREQLFMAGLTGRRVLVRAVLAINVLVWAGLYFAGGASTPGQLLAAGAKSNGLILAGQYWRLVTPVFLHVGLMHLLLNSAGLLFLGEVVERVYGSMQFALIYFLAGLAGTVASLCFGPEMMVGASGAIFGLAGALVVYGIRDRRRIPRRFGTMFGVGLLPIIGLNLLYGWLGHGVDNWAHVGGLAGGAVVALMLRPLADEPASESWTSPRRLAATLALGVVVGCVALGAHNYAVRRDPFATDARWTLSREVPGGFRVDVPASWAPLPRAADEAGWRSPAYEALVEVRSADATKDAQAAVAGEFARLSKMGFLLVVENPDELTGKFRALYSTGRADFRLMGPKQIDRRQAFLLVDGRLVGVAVEFPAALGPRIAPVLERVFASLPAAR